MFDVSFKRCTCNDVVASGAVRSVLVNMLSITKRNQQQAKCNACALTTMHVYTPSYVLNIVSMHQSNTLPWISNKDAVEPWHTIRKLEGG